MVHGRGAAIAVLARHGIIYLDQKKPSRSGFLLREGSHKLSKYNQLIFFEACYSVNNDNNVLFTLTSSIKLHCKCCRINKLSISTY